MPVTSCPDQKTLRRYSIGTLSDQESDELAAHLESCPDCQATIVTLEDADDTLIGRLRMPVADESCGEYPPYQAVLAEAMAMSGAGKGDAANLCEAPEGPFRQISCVPFSRSDMPRTLGEYQLLEDLGHGGMGHVYKALHTKLDRVVAIKVLSRGRVGDRQAIARFEREMRAVGQLTHPNIVQAYDAREIDDTPVLIMEYVDGLDLAEIVRRLAGKGDKSNLCKTPGGPSRQIGLIPFSGPDACELVRQTAVALQYAHEHGLVHRDIKPSNIMLSAPLPHSGRGAGGEGGSALVKLLDLGLARFYAKGRPEKGDAAHLPERPDEMTGTGQAMGTADYMAPEQASDSRSVDIRADLYSLGCTLYKLLSGRAPFSGPEYAGTLEKMHAHVHSQPVSIRRLLPDVPEGVATILDRLLAKNPDDRFATPAEAAEALAPWCEGADLPALIQRAVDAPSSPLPLGEGQGEGNAAARHTAAKPSLLLTSWGWKWFVGQLILLMMAGSLGFALGIMIRIQKDGQETTIDVPEGSNARVTADGQVDITLPGQGQQPGASPTADLMALQGPWKVVRVEKGANVDFPLPGMKSFDVTAVNRIQFEDRYLHAQDIGQGLTASLEYSIDPEAAPRTIDLRQLSSQGRPGELIARGVYELDGDRLRICLAKHWSSLKNERQPKGFAVGSPSADALLTLERYRPSADEKAMQGDWAVAKQVDDGKPVSEEMRRLRSLSFGSSYALFKDMSGMGRASGMGGMGGGMSDMYQCVLDPTKRPKTMTLITWDMVGFSLEFQKQELLGIYKFDGDQLTIAYRKGGPAPEKFESTPGSGVTLLVLKRAEPPKPAAGMGMGGMAGGRVMSSVWPQPQESEEPALQFGLVVERVVNAVGEGKGGEGLDLATGKLVNVSKEFAEWSAEQQNKWSTENNVDLVIDLVTGISVGGLDNKSLVLAPQGLKLAAIWDGRWEISTAEDLRSALSSPTPEQSISPEGMRSQAVIVSERHGVTYFAPFNVPLTFAFQTRKGDLGILQAIRFTEEPRGMRIRYKLVRPSATSAINAAEDAWALVGPWRVVSVKKGKKADLFWNSLLGGDRRQRDLSAFDRLTFSEWGAVSFLNLKEGRNYRRMASRIDPLATPKTIDLSRQNSIDKRSEPWMQGIYELDGDHLKIRWVRVLDWLHGDQRPNNFVVDADSADLSLVLERPSKDEKAVKGLWLTISQIENGKAVPDTELWDLMHGHDFSNPITICEKTPEGKSRDVLSGRWVLDATKQPKSITVFVGKENRQEDLLGIYKFDGNRLTIAYRKGGPEPEKFKSTSGSGVALLVLEKPKVEEIAKPPSRKTEE